MATVPSKLYSDDVSLLMVLMDANPFFWNSVKSNYLFSEFITHVIAFLNSTFLLNQFNQVVVIATGYNSCDYIFDSSALHGQIRGRRVYYRSWRTFWTRTSHFAVKTRSMAPVSHFSLDPFLWPFAIFRRCFGQVLFIHSLGYVAIMNSIFSAQRLMVPIDSCVIGAQHSAFLQQASYITGGIYLKPQLLDGLFQYLVTVYATDLHSRAFLQLPKPVGVDFRASCFCHKNTIDMGFICSVCLSIFCEHQKKCSTCGSGFGQSQAQNSSAPEQQKRKPPMHS